MISQIPKRLFRIIFIAFFSLICVLPVSSQANFPANSAVGRTNMTGTVQGLEIPSVNLEITQPQSGQEVAFSIQLLLLLTILTLAPSILILATSFLRFSIVLDFIKRALSLQQVPPTAVLNGIAFFMTLFYGNTGKGAPAFWERGYTFDYIGAYSQAAEKR